MPDIAPKEEVITFSEISTMLDKAMVDIVEKKKVFDKATLAVQVASSSYQDALNKAKVLRVKLNDKLNETLGSESDRIRISA
jgi:hypothetical protein